MVKGNNVFVNASNNNVIIVIVIFKKYIKVCAITELNNILGAP